VPTAGGHANGGLPIIGEAEPILHGPATRSVLSSTQIEPPRDPSNEIEVTRSALSRAGSHAKDPRCEKSIRSWPGIQRAKVTPSHWIKHNASRQAPAASRNIGFGGQAVWKR
jgi:hypothetical protein